MKRIISLVLAVLMLGAVALSLTACGEEGKLTVKEVNIISQNITMETDSFSSGHHHWLSTECKVHEDIAVVNVKFIFTKDGKSYVTQQDYDNLKSGSTFSFIYYLNLPDYLDEVFQNADPAGEPLTIPKGSDQDILDALGKGTAVTVEIYENGQKIGEGSATYE